MRFRSQGAELFECEIQQHGRGLVLAFYRCPRPLRYGPVGYSKQGSLSAMHDACREIHATPPCDRAAASISSLSARLHTLQGIIELTPFNRRNFAFCS